MSVPPVNSEEDYYMDEPFDEESLSEVEEEQEYEEQVLEESDSPSDTDVEAEFLRGNPHARRQQIFAKRTGGESAFRHQTNMTYASTSSEDEAQVVITKTVVEVNKSAPSQPEPTDDETMSVRTLIPNGGKGDLTDQEDLDENELTEVEDELEEEMEEEGDVVSENELTDEEKEDEDEVEIGQLAEDEQEDQIQPNQDLVDVVDAAESDQESPHNTDNELDNFVVPDRAAIAKPQKRTRGHQYHPNLARQPLVDADAPLVPKLENIYDDNGDEVYNLDDDSLPPGDPLNVKFLEQQMTQMSEMIMKTFRLSGGSADNSALEQLAMATKLMKRQGNKLSETDMDEEQDSMGSPKTQTSGQSETDHGACRCPSSSNLNEQDDDSFLMDECGQGDGLLRYSHAKHSHSARIDCRVSSVTPSSFNSDNSGYHIQVRRPRSVASSEVNYKNLGRKSFSFTNPQVREIERQNNILLKKMMNVKPTIKPATGAVKSSTNMQAKKQPPQAPRLTSAAVNRKKYQRQIDLDNDVLKRKLEAVGTRRPLFK